MRSYRYSSHTLTDHMPERERELCVCVEMLDILDSTLPDQNYWGQWMETMKVINWQNNLFCRPKFVKQITLFRCMYEKWKVGSNFLYNIRKELARNIKRLPRLMYFTSSKDLKWMKDRKKVLNTSFWAKMGICLFRQNFPAKCPLSKTI